MKIDCKMKVEAHLRFTTIKKAKRYNKEKRIKMSDILETLTKFKQQFSADGVEIIGIFGSVARNEATNTSDIDIAYRLSKEKFFSKYRGFEGVSKLVDIKNELSRQLHKKVDFVSIENSNQELVNSMKKELIYV